MAGGLSELKRLQLDFWTALSAFLKSSSFAAPKPAPKNWCYLPLVPGRAKIVLTIEAAESLLGCKLYLEHSPRNGQRDRAEAIFDHLSEDRAAIELELGFSDLDWGKPTPTRIYRYQPAMLDDRSAWPDAFEWLVDNAEKFKEVFGPRIRQLEPLLDADSGGGVAGAVPAARAPSRRRPQRTTTEKHMRESAVSTQSREIPDLGLVGGRPGGNGHPSTAEALAAVDALGEWSDWTPIAAACESAPRQPGVYMARMGCDGPVIYVGMAGERSRRGKTTPQGIRGRLRAYVRGQGLGGGLIGASFDRALADPDWLREQLAAVDEGKPLRATDWGKAALARADLHVRWLARSDPEAARDLERQCGRLLAGTGLWNRRV